MSKEVIESLAATRGRLLREIESLGFEELNRKPSSKGWSVAQICHHLFLTERAFTQAIIYGYTKRDGKKAEQKPIQLASDRTKKAAAPQMVVPTDEPLERKEIVDLLQESRSIFLEFYSQIEDKSVLAEKSAKHPLFGYLPLNQWVELIYLHEDRHIEQIIDVKLAII